MYGLKTSYASLMVLAIMSRCTGSSEYEQDRQFANVTSSPGEVEVVPPYWEDILREFIFRTISPSPPANNLLYKRILEAPFYGGPLPALAGNETTVILSRGNVFYFPSEHWILCQEGCVDCEACAEQRSPTVKWVLRRIKRHSSFLLPRYDLQLTIIPQADGTFHMKNLWPRSYVYVTPQSDKQQDRPYGIPGHPNWKGIFSHVNGTVLDRNYNKPVRSWRLVERNAESDKQDAAEEHFTSPSISFNSSSIAVTEQNILDPGLKHLTGLGHGLKSTQERLQPIFSLEVPSTTSLTPYDDILNIDSNGYNEAEQFTPKLILGTDYSGRKHVVHIIPAEDLTPLTSANANSLTSYPSVPIGNAGPNPEYNNTVESQALYEKLFRRILVSLKNNKKSIEKFLQSPKNNAFNGEQISSMNDTVAVQSIEAGLPSSTVSAPNNLQTPVKKEPFNPGDAVAYSSPGLITNKEAKNSQELKKKEEMMLFSKRNAVSNHDSQYQNLTRATAHGQQATTPKRIKQRRHRVRENAAANNFEVKPAFFEQKDENLAASYQQAGQARTPGKIERNLADGGFLRNVGNYRKETNGHLHKFDGLLNDNNSRNRPRHVRIEPLRLPIMERIRGATNHEETYQTNLRDNFTKSNSPPNVRADFARN